MATFGLDNGLKTGTERITSFDYVVNLRRFGGRLGDLRGPPASMTFLILWTEVRWRPVTSEIVFKGVFAWSKTATSFL